MYVMETIFDHNMTKEERHKLIGTMSEKEFFRGLDKDTSNGFLARLYLFRGNKERMMAYANKLPENMKQDFLYLLSPYD